MKKPEAVYSDLFQQILWHSAKNVQIMKWLPGTEGINYAQFKGCVLINAGTAQKNKAKFVLIDSREFVGEGIPMEEMWEWRSRESGPVYNSAGVRKFAFIHNPDTPIPPSSGEQHKNENFPTYHFHSMSKVWHLFGIDTLGYN